MNKYVIFPIAFACFVTSCNFFALTGAQTSLDAETFSLKSGGFNGPIVSDTSDDLQSGTSCVVGYAFKIYGANFTSSTRAYLMDNSTGSQVQELTVIGNSSSVIDVQLSEPISTSTYYIEVEDNGNTSAGARFNASCV